VISKLLLICLFRSWLEQRKKRKGFWFLVDYLRLLRMTAAATTTMMTTTATAMRNKSVGDRPPPGGGVGAVGDAVGVSVGDTGGVGVLVGGGDDGETEGAA